MTNLWYRFISHVHHRTRPMIQVFTDLLLNDSTPELRKFPFGVLAAQPEEVAQQGVNVAALETHMKTWENIGTYGKI